VVDRWIVSRLGHAIGATDQGFADYRFDNASSALYEFTWHEFCDWYLELAKPVLQGEDENAAALTRRTLLTVLEALLRALHPLMPFITEEIWQRVAPVAGIAGETIMRAAWPRAGDYPADAAATSDVDWMKGVILGLRQIRGEMDISPARRLAPLAQGATEADAAHFQRHQALLGRLAGIDPVRVLAVGETAPPSAAAVVGNLTLLVPMQGLIDPAAELERLKRKQEKNQQEITRALAKLQNPNFVNHAPPEVVATERERIAQFEKVNESLARQIQIVEGLV
jgi:valyl-tRNA synthetase